MARWFPSGLSALSGQISNFTKEVLADGVEEIDDHVTELRNAKSRIAELETVASAQKAELERVQQVNNELTIQLDAYELQRVALADQYRAELALREQEIKKLHEQLNDQQHSSPEFVHRFSSDSFNEIDLSNNGDVHGADFDDVISSQREINGLRSEVRRLTAEVKHWHHLANDSQSASVSLPDPETSSQSVAQLQAQLQTLQKRLADTVDDHQRQLSSLQDVHRSTVATLKSTHSKTVEQLRKQLETAAGAITAAAVPVGGDVEELKQLREQLRDTEKVRMKLEYDLEHTHAADHKKALVINELNEQLATFKSQADKVCELERQAETYRQQVEQFEMVNSDWDLEKASLEELVVKLRQETRLKDEALHSTPIKKRVDEKNVSMMGIDSEVAAAGTALKTEPASGDRNDDEIKTLHEQLTATLSENEQLKVNVDDLSTQIGALKQELEHRNGLVENLKMEMESAKSEHKQELEKANGIADDYRQNAEKGREDLAAVLSEKQALETLVGQHKNELGVLLTEKNELEKTVRELTERCSDLASENVSVKRQIDELVSSRSEDPIEAETRGKSSSLTGENGNVAELEQELETCRSELDRLRSCVMQREKEHDESITELSNELDLLRSQKDEMERSRVELAGKEEEPAVKSHTEFEALQAELKSVVVDRENSEKRVAELTSENESLKESLEENQTVCKLYESEVERLTAVEDQLRKELSIHPAAEVTTEKHLHDDKIVSELRTEIEVLKSNLERKDSELNEWKQRVSEVEKRASPAKDLTQIVTELEKEISELKAQLVSRGMESDGWKNKFEEGLQANKDQMKVLSKLESEVSDLSSELASKDKDLLLWERKLEAVEKSSVEKVKYQEGVISDLEKELSGVKSQLDVQHAQLEESKVRMERLVKTESDSRQNAAAASELENGLADLRYQLASRDLELEERKNKIKDLEQKVTAMAGENQRTEEELQRSRAASVQNRTSLTNGVESKTIVENGQHGDTEHETSQLQSTINQQKDIIDTLNSKYDSLRALLEDRSQETHGSSVLSDLHRLEVEARELRADRERLLTVLGEKTRESSGLRAEVHRLTSVAAASQSALNKAHRDSHHVANSARIEANQDMKNEAVKKLSQLIKDRDLEIEALILKNATLTQVLQDTVPDGSKLAAVFSEANSLRTQLTVFQSDREQLIAALTSKHQESVGFYEESRRLAAHVAQLNDEVQYRSREHESLTLQYEENKRSLCSALGELATLRQRRTELERQLANIPQQSSPMFSIGPLEDSSVVRSGAANTEAMPENANDAGDREDSDEISVELESLRSEIRRSRDAVVEKEAAIRERDRRIADLERSIGLKNAAMEAKLNEVSEVSTKLRVAEQTLSARGSELLSARKQCESAAFELQGERVSKKELTEERDELRRRMESLGGELQAVQMSYSALATSAGQKDFELASLRDQVASLQKVVESGRGASHDERHQEELKMMSAQLDGVRLQAQTLQYERDNSLMALQQLQAESAELKNEVARLYDREQRLVKECDRLRSHLVQMEESYTREAVEAEEREKQLRNRLSTVEEKIISSSSAMHNVQLDSAKHVENLQIQLHALAEQRDNALYQLSSAQERISSYASSLSNLQMVLEQFQAERQQQQSLEIERYRRDYQREHDEAEKLRRQLHDLQIQLNEASDALEAAHRLSEQLDRKDTMISALREEVHLREAELAKTEEQVRRLTTTTESKIDKIIIKNLLLGYFHTPPPKRNEALQIIGHVLSYSRDEMKEIASLSGSGAEGGGWIGGLFRRKPSTSSSSPSHSRPSSSAANNPYHRVDEKNVSMMGIDSEVAAAGTALKTEPASGDRNDDEIKTLHEQLTATLSENEQLKVNVDDLSTQIGALKQELEHRNGLVENLKMEMESAKSEHKQELEKANGIADDYRQNAEKGREDLAAVLSEKQALETLVGQHKNELGVLLTEKNELEKTVRELTERCSDLASENVSVKRQIDELVSSRSEDPIEAETRGKSSSLTGENGNVAELEQELETCRSELDRLRSCVMQREKEHDESITELSNELDLLRSQKDEMERSRVELAGKEEEPAVKSHTEFEALQAELKSVVVDRENSEKRVAELTSENESLKESLEENQTVCKLYESEVERLTAVEDQLRKELSIHPAAEVTTEKHLHDDKIVSELRTEIEVLKSNLERKDSELNEWKQRVSEVEKRASPAKDLTQIVTELEKEISELKAQLVSRGMESDGWKNKFEEGLQANKDQMKVLSKLESEVSDLSSELASKDKDLLLWERKLEAVEKSSVEKVKYQEGVISDLEKELSGVKSQLDVQHAQLEESKVRMERLVKTESDSRQNAAAASELENGLADLRYQLASRDLELEERKNKIKDLEQKVTAMAGENQRTEEELQRSRAASVQNRTSLTNGVESKTIVENGQHGDTEHETSQLQSTINQQKDIIDTLNSKYDSLRALLEDRSQETHGSSVLSDLHRLEVEARELRADRERLLTVLGEKTRESSGLRAEVHRLTSVAAASQSALNKAHRDSHHVANSARIEANQDMKNEAVKKLSQLIKDRDLEIEALILKNATLTQVLQDTVPDGSKLAAVFSEANSLRTQLTVFQSDREQLIAALTSKHQESVGFYEESRRLAAHVAQLNDEVQYRSREHESLTLQYEENKRSLCSALGELATLRQRRTELERQLANIPQQSSPMFSIGPLEDSSVVRSGAANTEAMPENANDAGDREDSDEISVELESLRSEIRRSRDAVVEKEAAIRERDRRIADLERSIGLKNAAMEAKLNEVSEVSTKLRVAEQTLSARGSELLSARKQCESAAFELQGERVSKKELTEERDELRRRMESLGGELQAVQMSYSALATSAGQKDFELASLRDQVASLQKVVESGRGASHDERHQEELKMMSAQLDGVRLQAQTLQYERDNSLMALQQLQAESAELKNEVARLYDREQRLVKECDRLRSHLVQMEESYTREAVEAEEREKQLRNRLSTVEEKIISSSSAMHNVQLDSAKHVENLQIQLHALAEQRDNALYQLSSAQERISSYASSLSNLQMVLEQFQAERQQQQSLEIERYRRDYQREHDEAEKLRRQLHDLQIQLNEASDALEAAHRLSEQLDRKDTMISALREEVHLREAELAKTEEQVRRLTTTTESKIDKIIIKNLLLGYFHTPPPKRNEALQIIGHVLSYSRDEMKEIASLSGSGAEGGGWIGGLFRRKPSTSSSSPSHSRPSSSAANNPYHSFTELFVNFLERESTPQPTAVKLPTDRMIQEQQQKQQRRTPTSTTPAFNPFSASVLHPSSALLTASGELVNLPSTGNSDSMHPLMRPISPPRLPVFAPVVSDHDTSLSQQSGRSSADNSGRSTPSSGTSLRDLLQQR